jgi:hypothetical protein
MIDEKQKKIPFRFNLENTTLNLCSLLTKAETTKAVTQQAASE